MNEGTEGSKGNEETLHEALWAQGVRLHEAPPRRRPCSCVAHCKGADGLASGFYCEMHDAIRLLRHQSYRIRKPMLWWSDGKDGRARFRAEIQAGEVCTYFNGVFVFPGRESFDGEGVCPWLSRYIVEESRDWFEPVEETKEGASDVGYVPRYHSKDAFGNWWVKDADEDRIVCMCNRQADSDEIAKLLNKKAERGKTKPHPLTHSATHFPTSPPPP